jgi:hypothetical protein
MKKRLILIIVVIFLYGCTTYRPPYGHVVPRHISPYGYVIPKHKFKPSTEKYERQIRRLCRVKKPIINPLKMK